MVNVKFENLREGIQTFPRRETAYKGIVGFLVNNGLAKDDKMANVILVSVTIICLVITGIMIFSGNGESLKRQAPRIDGTYSAQL